MLKHIFINEGPLIICPRKMNQGDITDKLEFKEALMECFVLVQNTDHSIEFSNLMVNYTMNKETTLDTLIQITNNFTGKYHNKQ